MSEKNLICIGLCLLTFASLSNVLFSDFILLDDPMYVTNNSHVLTGLSSENTRWAFTDSCAHSGFFFPLIWLSLQLDASLFGGNGAWGFHLDNLIVHSASVILFFLTLQRMTVDLWRSAIAAALFAVHPLRVESVAWVTERKDVLGMLFLLLTIAAYVWYAERPGWRRYCVVVACYFFGLMSKVTLMTLPFGLLLLDFWPLYRLQLGQTIPPHVHRTGTAWPRLVAEKIPLLSAAVAIAVANLMLLGSTGQVSEHPFGTCMLNALSGYLGYLQKTFWPADLAVLYPLVSIAIWHALLAAIILLAITFLMLRWRRELPALTVGWLWFLGTLVPQSGIIQMGPQAMADRFTYIPHLGLMIMLVWGISNLKIWCSFSSFLQKSLVTALVLLCATLTWMQTCFWQDSRALFQQALSVNEKNHIIQCLLGRYLASRGDMDGALLHCKIACEIHPDPKMEQQFGAVLLQDGRYQEADECLRRSLEKAPSSPDGHYLLAIALSRLGKWKDTRFHLQKALALWSATPTSVVDSDKVNRGGAHQLFGDLQLRQGDARGALEQYALSLELLPNQSETHEWMGIALGRLGRWREAEQKFRDALALQPECSSCRGYLAYAGKQQGDEQLAAQQYAMLLRQTPQWLNDTNKRALTLATEPSAMDAQTAVELAQQVVQASDHRNPEYLATLAAAFAAIGELAKARESVNRALALNPEPVLMRQLQEKLSVLKQQSLE